MLDTLHDPPSAFRAAIEKRDHETLKDALAEDVTLYGPMVSEPYHGRDAVGGLVARVVFHVFQDVRYVGELREGSDEVLRFQCLVGDTDIEGVDLVRYDDEGKVKLLTLIVRPIAAMRAFEQAFGGGGPRPEFGAR